MFETLKVGREDDDTASISMTHVNPHNIKVPRRSVLIFNEPQQINVQHKPVCEPKTEHPRRQKKNTSVTKRHQQKTHGHKTEKRNTRISGTVRLKPNIHQLTESTKPSGGRLLTHSTMATEQPTEEDRGWESVCTCVYVCVCSVVSGPGQEPPASQSLGSCHSERNWDRDWATIQWLSLMNHLLYKM